MKPIRDRLLFGGRQRLFVFRRHLTVAHHLLEPNPQFGVFPVGRIGRVQQRSQIDAAFFGVGIVAREASILDHLNRRGKVSRLRRRQPREDQSEPKKGAAKGHSRLFRLR